MMSGFVPEMRQDLPNPGGRTLGQMAALPAPFVIAVLLVVLTLVNFNPFPLDTVTFGGAKLENSPYDRIWDLTFFAFVLAFVAHAIVQIVAIRRVDGFAAAFSSPIVIGLYLLAAVSSFYSAAPTASAYHAIVLLSASIVLIHFSAPHISEPGKLRFTLLAATSVCLVVSLLGVFVAPDRSVHIYSQGMLLNESLSGSWRGIFFHKNVAGGVIMIASIISLAGAVYSRRRLLSSLIFLLSIFFIIKSESATAVFAPALAIIASVPVVLLGRLSSWIAASCMALTVAVVPLLVTFFLYPQIGFAADGRAPIWELNFKFIFDRPIFGYGYRALYSGAVDMRSWDNFGHASRVGSHAHNGFLEMWGQLGLIGAALMIIATAHGVQRWVSVFWSERGAERKWTAFTIIVVIIALIVRGWFEPDFLSNRANWFLFLLIYVAGGVYIRGQARAAA